MANQKEGLLSFFVETKTQAYKRKHDVLGNIFLKQLETTQVGLCAENPGPYNRRVGELQREYQQAYAAPLRQRFGVMIAGKQIPFGTREAVAGIIRVTKESFEGAKHRRDITLSEIETTASELWQKHRNGDITSREIADKSYQLEQQYEDLRAQAIKPKTIVSIGSLRLNFPQRSR